MYNSGSVVIARVQFTDTYEIKKRPALVLYEDLGNLVVAGITSNTKMNGIPLLKEDGMIKESVIKINYIFTISENMVYKKLFDLNINKKNQVFNNIVKKLEHLKNN